MSCVLSLGGGGDFALWGSCCASSYVCSLAGRIPAPEAQRVGQQQES